MKNKKIKKVLIALDYDPTAKKVAEDGFSFAKTMGAEVTLLHVISDPLQYVTEKRFTVMGFAGYNDTAPLVLDCIGELKKESQRFLDRSKQHLGDKSILTVVKEGGLAESILETGKKLHSDIIVIGSHSRRWMENIILGSVAEKVLRYTDIPLLIIPTKKQNKVKL